MVSVLPGFKFNPRDHEVMTYLECKAKDQTLPCEGVILETNLYGDKEPWEIFQDLGGRKRSRYLFTHLKKKKDNGTQIHRKIGISGGTWNADTKGTPIHENGGDQGMIIGMKKSFSYSNKNLKEGDRDFDRLCKFKWLMTEFTLSEDLLKEPGWIHKNYAVCFVRKMKNNKSYKIKNRGTDNDSDEDSDSDNEEEVVPENNGQEQGEVNYLTNCPEP